MFYPILQKLALLRLQKRQSESFLPAFTKFREICALHPAAVVAGIPFVLYSTFMGPEIVCVPSAFKHKVSETDIRWAVRTYIGEFLVDEYKDVYDIKGEEHAAYD